jgi:hypothetical protein
LYRRSPAGSSPLFKATRMQTISLSVGTFMRKIVA